MLVDGSGSAVAPPIAKPAPAPGPAAKPNGIDLSSLPQLSAGAYARSEAVGVYWGSFAARDPAVNARNFERLLELYAQKKIEPKIGRTYAFEDAAQAIVDLENHTIVGKAVVRVRD